MRRGADRLAAEAHGILQSDVCNSRLEAAGCQTSENAEVLSPSTASYDRTIKLAAYERAGVPETWLIDPADRTVTIHRLAAGHYTQPVVLELKGHTTITALPGISIDWDRLLSFP